jgi:hypothetical protein
MRVASRLVAVAVSIWVGGAVLGAPGATAATKMISAAHGGFIPLKPGVRLSFPRHALERTTRVTVSFVGGGYRIQIRTPWHGSLYVIVRARGKRVVRPVRGVVALSAKDGAASLAHAAGVLESGDLCFELSKESDGPELSGFFFVGCMIASIPQDTSSSTIPKPQALQVGGQIGGSCTTAVQSAPDPVPLSLFYRPDCNPLEPQPAKPSSGPSIVQVTPTTAPSKSAPLPPPSPVYPAMNTSETSPDGVYFRNSPHTADTDGVSGHGVYAGERVRLDCYSWGDAVGPYSNRLWYKVLNVTRPTNAGVSNSGFLNAHYINDGAKANVVDTGVPAC